MTVTHFKSKDSLIDYIKSGTKTLFVGSRTSTVVPYEFLDEKYPNMALGDLSSLPGKLSLDEQFYLRIEGAVSWKEAREYCLANGREIMTSPTEELALCLSGIATSCTGERCFGYGTLRDQIVDLKYINWEGKECYLSADKNFSFSSDTLEKYQESYEPYRKFKNAPFPRFEKETDLMVGTEGQLGIVVEARFKTVPRENELYLFIKLDKWESCDRAHLEIFDLVQNFRDQIKAVEFIDENSISYLPAKERPCEGKDLIFLELGQENLDLIYEKIISKLKYTTIEDVFEMSSSKCREFRMNIPRYIFEENQRMGVTKVGTDVQTHAKNFRDLLKLYRGWKDFGVNYNLFGHFGDAHLHFNFMPKPKELASCQKTLESFYEEVYKMGASPFAEHGIGLIKQKFIKDFYTDVHIKLFSELKASYDPNNIFFPLGFMSNKQ